jgi:hypothetical protein
MVICAVGTAVKDEAEGPTDGIRVGAPAEIIVGVFVGVVVGIDGKYIVDGTKDGPALGDKLGVSLGDKLGVSLGVRLGVSLGERLGTSLGDRLGLSLGRRLGASLCKRLAGPPDGKIVGILYKKGECTGGAEGNDPGMREVCAVGVAVIDDGDGDPTGGEVGETRGGWEGPLCGLDGTGATGAGVGLVYE